MKKPRWLAIEVVSSECIPKLFSQEGRMVGGVSKWVRATGVSDECECDEFTGNGVSASAGGNEV